MEHGVSLQDAIRGAATKDGGFSRLMLAWIVKNMPLEYLASTAGLENGETERLLRFREEFVDRLAEPGAPAG